MGRQTDGHMHDKQKEMRQMDWYKLARKSMTGYRGRQKELQMARLKTDRWKDKCMKDTCTDRQTDREREREREINKVKWPDYLIGRETDRQTERKKDKWPD